MEESGWESGENKMRDPGSTCEIMIDANNNNLGLKNDNEYKNVDL